MPDLCTLEDVKRFLDYENPETASDDDEKLQQLITYAGAALAGMADWPRRDDGESVSFAEDTYRESYDGPGAAVLLLRRHPLVTTVVRVTVDGREIPRATDAVMPGFTWDRFSVRLRGHRFTKGYGNVEVICLAGFPEGDPILEELRQAAIEMVAYITRTKPFIGIQSKTLGDESIVFMRQAAPERVNDLVARLRGRVAA